MWTIPEKIISRGCLSAASHAAKSFSASFHPPINAAPSHAAKALRPKHFCRSKIDSWVRFAIDHGVEKLRFSLNICESISWSLLKSLSMSMENVTDDVPQKILMGSPVLGILDIGKALGCKKKFIQEV
ncbi:hypothetical protein NL676_008677 [Syzygium grande]|nr:hypothetical protein NL676_008677 [Syzygium grande]